MQNRTIIRRYRAEELEQAIVGMIQRGYVLIDQGVHKNFRATNSIITHWAQMKRVGYGTDNLPETPATLP